MDEVCFEQRFSAVVSPPTAKATLNHGWHPLLLCVCICIYIHMRVCVCVCVCRQNMHNKNGGSKNWCYCYTRCHVCGVAIKECSGSALRPEKLIVEMMAWRKYLHIELFSDENMCVNSDVNIYKRKHFHIWCPVPKDIFSVSFLKMSSTWFQIEITLQFPCSIKSHAVALGELPYGSRLGQAFPWCTCMYFYFSWIVFLLHLCCMYLCCIQWFSSTRVKYFLTKFAFQLK